MDTPLLCMAGPGTGPSNSAVRYGLMSAGHQQGSWTGTLAIANQPIAQAGTISSIRAVFPAAITTGQYDLALMVNSVAVLTGSITSGTTLNIAGPVSVAAGDVVCWRVTPTGTPPAQTVVQISCIFTATTTGKSVLFAMQATGTAAQYLALGCANATTRTALNTAIPMPTAGVIDKMYVAVQTAPGVGNTRVYTLYKNGSPTALTVTVADAATSGSMTGGAVSFAAGDTVNIRLEITGTPASTQANLGLDWSPTIDGESLLFSAFASAQSGTNIRYSNLNGSALGTIATETDTYNNAPAALTLRKMYAVTDVAPNTGKSRTVAVRLGGATQALSVAISGASVSGNDTTNSVSVAQDNLLNLISTPAGTPDANTFLGVSMVAFIAPPAVASRRRLALLGVA